MSRVDRLFVHTRFQDLDFLIRRQVASIPVKLDLKRRLDRQEVDILDTTTITFLERDTQEHGQKG